MPEITFLLRQPGFNPESWTFPTDEIMVGTLEARGRLWVTTHFNNGAEMGRFEVTSHDEQAHRYREVKLALEGDEDRVVVFPTQLPQNLIECRIINHDFHYVVPATVSLETKRQIRDEFHTQFHSLTHTMVGGMDIDGNTIPALTFERFAPHQPSRRLIIHLNPEAADEEREALSSGN